MEPQTKEPPYIGLRYFEEADASLFYGRDEHVTELLGKLARNRFVAVLGSSGSGKSSLVRAGLLPELRSGMIPQAGPRWVVIEFKPGNGPLQELAAGVHSALGVQNAAALIEEGPLGLVNAVAAVGLETHTNFLVIADQFEEVFRFQREQSERGQEAEAIQQSQAMVRGLLEAVTATGMAIYVLLVMRSDYLGECSQFPDLPERINQSVYLVPRLRRDQVQESITAPVGRSLEPALLQELLGKAVGDPDQLPRLQHLLSRMWDLAGGSRMTMVHYKAAGGWDGALGQHLDQVYDPLGESGQTACARMFQRLSEVDERGRVVRRRASLEELIEVCGAEAGSVVSAFQKEGFLKPGDPVDITHECVLRKWDKIKVWLREETEARDFYREMKVRRGRGTLLTGSDVGTAFGYFTSGLYSAAWARRYGSTEDFNQAFLFARDSHLTEQKSHLHERLLRWAIYGLAVACFSAVVWAGFLQRQQNKDLQTMLQAVQAFAGSKDANRSSQQNAPATNDTGFYVQDLARLYDFPTELKGTGQTIGLIELGGGYIDSDLKQYFSQLNLSVPKTAIFQVAGATNHPGGVSDSQVTGDIEIAGTIAPEAQIVIYFAPNTNLGIANAINSAINDSEHHPSILSIGWGGPEPTWTPASIQSLNQALQQASERNVTVVAAAGDQGVTDGISKLPAVDFPASSPLVLAVGGTHVTASDLEIKSETVWNDGQNQGATGGGVSSLFPVPSWQNGLSIPAPAKGPPGRGVPDVAANASPRAGYRLFVHGDWVTLGGTSMVAPLWAGLVALLNQGLRQNLGYLNPLLYEKVAHSGAFRNITQGNNSYGGVTGYSAGPGWNPCTGWGSPDGRVLLVALKAFLGK